MRLLPGARHRVFLAVRSNKHRGQMLALTTYRTGTKAVDPQAGKRFADRQPL